MTQTSAARLSISIPSRLLDFADQYREEHTLESRSEVFTRALELLREQELRAAYRAASEEWDGSEDAKLWENTIADGL
jgi:metal-responsive CopG/Arc/MetJ family transcriptional regulator